MTQEKWPECFQEQMALEVSLLVRRYKEQLVVGENRVLRDQILEMFEELDVDYHSYLSLLHDIKNKYLFFI